MLLKFKLLLLFCIIMGLFIMLAGCEKAEDMHPSVISSEVPNSNAGNSSDGSQPESSLPDAEPSSDTDTAPTSSETGAKPSETAHDQTDIFYRYRGQAAYMTAQMSTEEKVWQVFLAAIPDGADAAVFAQEHPAGGYLLFRWDFEGLDAEDVREKMAGLSEGSVQPLLAVDEEGGEIVRVSWFPALREEHFPAPSVLWAQGGADAVYGDALEKGQFLSSLGLNLCLAPVADVSQDPSDYIYSRTVGRDARETSWYVSAAVRGLQDGGVGAVMKHFPGYGNNVNTHTGIAVDERLLAQFKNEDLLPFEAGITAGCASILVSHNIVCAFDDEHPASLSEAVHDYLREEMGFSGLIMTDDLNMDAITQYTGNEAPSVMALKAGNDLLIYGDAENGVQDVLTALEDGTLDISVVDRAVEQVLAYKLWLGIVEPSEA